MILEPNAIVLYVDDLEISSQFYEDLLGIKFENPSPTFNAFTLSNGMGFGLKTKHSVIPAADNIGGGELAFTVDNSGNVDELFAEWRKKGISIAQPPTTLAYGYTFLALDPNGNRLRVVSLDNKHI